VSDSTAQIRLPKLFYSYAEWTVAAVEPRNYRLRGNYSTHWAKPVTYECGEKEINKNSQLSNTEKVSGNEKFYKWRRI